MKLLSTAEIMAKYGKPGAANLTTIKLPYRMRVAWDRGQTVGAIQCHKAIAANLLAVFNDLLAHYGLTELQRLGIDLYGGCYNYRKMRGGTSWSVHAWGLALDLDPDRNLLRETSRTARFARPEYKPMIAIFYRHGFIGLGPERNFDWMHFQIGG